MYTNFHKIINMTNSLGQQFWFIRSSCLRDMCIVVFRHVALSTVGVSGNSRKFLYWCKYNCILESAALENVCPPFYLLLQRVSTISECEKRAHNHANIPLFSIHTAGTGDIFNFFYCFSKLYRLPEQIQLVFGMGAMLS